MPVLRYTESGYYWDYYWDFIAAVSSANHWYGQYQAVSSALAAANSTINSLSTENSTLTAQRDALQTQYNEVSTQLAEANELVATRDAELTTAREDLANVEGELASTEAELLAEQQAHLQTVVDAQIAAQIAQEEILALSDDLTATQEERDQAVTDLGVVQGLYETSQANLAIETLRAIEAVPRAFGDIMSTMFGQDRAEDLVNLPLDDLINNFQFTLPEGLELNFNRPERQGISGGAFVDLRKPAPLKEFPQVQEIKPEQPAQIKQELPKLKKRERQPVEFPKRGPGKNFPTGQSKNFPTVKGGLLRNVDEEQEIGLLQRFSRN